MCKKIPSSQPIQTFLGLFIYFQTGDVFFSEAQKSELGEYIEDGKTYQVADIKDFKFIINQNICNLDRITFVSIVNTAPDYFDARSTIR